MRLFYRVRSAIWNATWGVVVSICVWGIFYPDALVEGATLLLGCLGWIVGKFAIGWWGFIRFLAAFFSIVLIMSAWCGHRARNSVLQTGIVADLQQWEVDCTSVKATIWEILAVISAILWELLLPIVLLLALLTILEAVVSLLDIEDAWHTLVSDIIAELNKIWTRSPADIHTGITQALQKIKSPAQLTLQKGIAVIAGTISVGVSLVLFLLRRRAAYLNAAQVISGEIDLIMKDAFKSVPTILTNRIALANRPHGQLLIGATADRKFLLLDPGTGLAVKLPACVVRPAVAFFQADQSLNQLYAGLLSKAFAAADAARRQEYLEYIDKDWRLGYQPTAYTALLRLSFYIRLRRWFI